MTAPAYVETFNASISLAKRVEPAKCIPPDRNLLLSVFTNASVPLAAAVSLTMEPSASSELPKPIGGERTASKV